MAESTLSQTFNELKADLGFWSGLGRSGWASAESTQLEAWIKHGLRQAYRPPRTPFQQQRGLRAHSWSFLSPLTTLTTQTPYSTGTITVVDGVVTLASGTFPAWAASGVLIPNGYGPYEVNTRDGDSQVTLNDLTLDVAAGTTYTLNQWSYDLPENFGWLVGGFTYAPNNYGQPIDHIDLAQILQMRQAGGASTGRPSYAATRVIAGAPSGSTGQRWAVDFDVAPDASYILNYEYHVLADAHATTTYPYGGSAFAQCILDSCIAVWELSTENARGPMWANFMDSLQAAIDSDTQRVPRTLGYNADRSDDMRYERPAADHNVTLYGTPI